MKFSITHNIHSFVLLKLIYTNLMMHNIIFKHYGSFNYGRFCKVRPDTRLSFTFNTVLINVWRGYTGKHAGQYRFWKELMNVLSSMFSDFCVWDFFFTSGSLILMRAGLIWSATSIVRFKNGRYICCARKLDTAGFIIYPDVPYVIYVVRDLDTLVLKLLIVMGVTTYQLCSFTSF